MRFIMGPVPLAVCVGYLTLKTLAGFCYSALIGIANG